MVNNALCIAHSNHNDLGRFPATLSEIGFTHERVNFLVGQKPLHGSDLYDGVVVFGGMDSLAQGLGKGYQPELRFLESCIEHGVPIIGICLGGQLLSKIYGGAPTVKTAQRPEIGFCEIKPSAAAPQDLWNHRKFFQWHWDDMPCPAEGINLGSTDEFECQAFSVDKSLALQFHPDATPTTVAAWMDLGEGTVTQHSEKSKAHHVEEAFRYETAVQKWTADLLRYWFGVETKT
ncbi:type 1 glutamine amidotransferase [Sulfitobacter sp. R86518]|uniref:type 1 glutamine amidotransferase n=1 Tax=Sulfitobacter sp. R86518 TaxID=3093858 RepID=UPI0036DA99DC